MNESIDMAQQVMRVKLNQLRGLYDAIAPSEAPSSN
jgi:hypothetical protein